MSKEKKHVPWTKKDLGKTFSFFRDATASEMPPPSATVFMSSGCVSLIPLVKDRGKLMSIEVSTRCWLERSYGSEDEDAKCTFIKRRSIYYEYRFETKNRRYESSSNKMQSGINKQGLLSQATEKKPAKQTAKKKK